MDPETQSGNRCENDTENEMVEMFKEIVRSNGILEPVSSVIVKDADLKGAGFVSLAQLVTINFENAQVKPLNLFVKKLTNNPSNNELIAEMKAFEKEAALLVDYVTAANKMCAAKGKEGFIDFYPKCYFGNDKMLVLENLLVKGYKTISMDLRQDLEAARFSVQSLAKHHAIAHVMIQESGGPKSFFQKYPDLEYECFEKPLFATMLKSYLESSIYSCAQILEKCGIPGADKKAKAMKEALGTVWDTMLNAMKIDEHDKLHVLGHGDYWNNNMMFLMDKQTNQILHHIIIDFQITTYYTPAIDLGFLLFASVQPKIRQKHLHDLLKLYTETFNKVTKDFGQPANWTFEEVLMDYRKNVGFGFYMGIGLAIGPVLAICKEVDIASVDPTLWGEVISDQLKKWSDENPEQNKEAGEELLGWIQEYEQLVLPGSS